MSQAEPMTIDELVAAGRDTTEEVVRVERAEDRATVTLAEPERLNALSAAVVQQLKAALAELTADPAIRAIVLTGEDPGFSAGGDLAMMDNAIRMLQRGAEYEEGTPAIWRWIRGEFGAIARTIARSDVAFIAAINGPAAGVGLAWALTCDLAIASERAKVVPAFGRLGLLPEVGTSWAITRRLGYQGAFAYYFGGEVLDAERARELGLVHEVVPHDELLARAGAWAERICAAPPHVLKMTKPLLRAAADGTWEAAITMEEFAEPAAFTTGAFARAVRSFAAAAQGEQRYGRREG